METREAVLRVVSSSQSKRPHYSAEIDRTCFYCANVEGVVRLTKHHERTISTGDVYKSINIPAHSRFRLLERLNEPLLEKWPDFRSRRKTEVPLFFADKHTNRAMSTRIALQD
jgi:hypothetical protein